MWKAILAAAFLCLAADSYGQPSSGAGPPNKEAPHASADQEKQPTLQPGPASVPEAYKSHPDKYAEACYQAQNHDTADLCAQWRAAMATEQAADATEWGNYIDGGGALLSFIGIVLVLIALGQTRKANQISDRQTQIASDTAKHQLRAYVLAIDHRVSYFYANGRPEFAISIKNSGQTPAYDVRCVTLVRATELDVDAFPFRFRDNKEPVYLSSAVIGPGDFQVHRNRAKDLLAHEAWTAIQGGHIHMLFAGIISYRDAFGRRRLSTFRYYLDVSGNIKDTAFDLFACGKGNNAN